MSTSAPFPLSTDTAPMEAKRADAIPDDQGVWQYEPKWDGFRCLAFKAGDAVDIRAKSGKPLARYFPELVEFLRDLSGTQIVIDGEILIECCGEYSFDALQMRLHPAESRIRKLAVETEALVKSIGNAGIELSPATLDFKQAQKWLGDSGGKTDGVVAKQLDGPYLPGERAMVKVKRMRTADCVVGGFRYLAERREVGSLLLGLYDEDGKLDHVGFTSTISNDERAALTGRLEALRESPGFTGNAPGGPSRWSTQRSGDWEPLRPELVVEVRFDHVTGNRFRHGTKLLRWRPDKAPRQCTFDQLR
ncbi:ATP-dependent DNA ligase [Mesorhizobium sp. BR1-1-2]|uniref:ATP-dependent DNA ligase n=1 Tax=Mesorhizobium sp. BR1-1-2 TaxID=2876652 RepID=UPI001CCB5280|nr:ATP-dependent DNA ligase [Mesorhizobium sp. BR1-1-2]MBZ9965792.1 ATP-dependent DNA ligase [Mesorhizobium sp. BR1-1-2]